MPKGMFWIGKSLLVGTSIHERSCGEFAGICRELMPQRW
jgi:hypothetical protein